MHLLRDSYPGITDAIYPGSWSLRYFCFPSHLPDWACYMKSFSCPSSGYETGTGHYHLLTLGRIDDHAPWQVQSPTGPAPVSSSASCISPICRGGLRLITLAAESGTTFEGEKIRNSLTYSTLTEVTTHSISC